MLKRLIAWVADTCYENGSYVHITGTGADTDVYMVRHFVIPRNRFFNIYIHTFLRSDRDDFHDHPWGFWTMIVRGSYKEEVAKTWNKRSKKWVIETNARHTWHNSMVFRKPTDLHRVTLSKQYTLDQKDVAPMTLCITGPVVREWGFVKEGKWIDWRTYLGLPKDTESR